MPALPCIRRHGTRPAHAVLHPGSGFTLIEVTIVVAVVGLLAAIAYPSYQRFIDASRRTDAMAALLDGAQRLERCFTLTNRYSGCAVPSDSPSGHYVVAATLGADAYALVATPIGVQQRDAARCANLALDHRGTRSATGSLGNACWR
jgi:type IV pilus assembly protein PilE